MKTKLVDFDIEKARNGAIAFACNLDHSGARHCRIICFDLMGEFPIISWVLNHQWRDITKELPPYEVPVLVHRDDGIYLEMRYDKNKVFNPCLDEYGFDIDDKGFNNEARYWMSIPNLPDVNKK